MRVVSENKLSFPNPEALSQVPVYDLLQAAASGRVGIDLRFIRALLSHGEQAVDDLLRFALEDRSSDRVELETDLIDLFRRLDSKRALPYFIRCLREAPEDVPDDLTEAILNCGSEAIGPLLDLHDDLGEEERSDVLFLLAMSGDRSPRVLAALREHMEFDLADGAFLMGVNGDPAVIPVLEKRRAEVAGSDPELERELRAAVEAIESHHGEPRTPEPLPAVDELYPDTAPPPFEVLDDKEVLAMIESPSGPNRAAAVEAFRSREITKAVETRLFAFAKEDAEAAVRAMSWEVLGDSESKEIRKAMRTTLDNEQAPLPDRLGAMVGLATGELDSSVAKRIRDFYGKPETRAKAMEAMWRSFDRQFADYFPKHLDDADPELKRQAIWGIGNLGIGAQAGRLEAFFDDDQFRSDALFAYALSVPGEVSRARAMNLFRKVESAAGGLSPGETELVKMGLDQRLMLHGMEPYFTDLESDGDEEEQETEAAPNPKVGRNDPCPCGSGKKYKKCHGG